MTASAIAARAAQQAAPSTGLLIVVVGGIVEGLALGILQAAWMATRFPGLSRLWWVVTTVVVAGVGWTLASAPATLGEASGPQPALIVILVAAAGLGMAMGALMGAAQALVLRRVVSHPWRWVPISAVAWTPAMVLIFAGATLPDATWPTALVIVVAALTGLAAGAVLGLVSIALMSSLTEPLARGRRRP